MGSVYAAAGGHEGMVRLAHAWHERALADEVVSHAFSHGFRDDHAERLAAYWAQALGGPDTFTDAFATESEVVAMTSSSSGGHGTVGRAERPGLHRRGRHCRRLGGWRMMTA